MTHQKSKRVKKYFPLYIVVLIFTFCVLISAPLTMAQQITLSLSPPLLEVFIKPGKSVLIAYQLENLADPTILTARVLPFSPLGNQGQVKIKQGFEGPIRFSLDNSNLKLNQPFFLKTKDSQQLLLRIRVPEGTPEGDYYYTLLTETKPTLLNQGESLSSAKATVGSHILITVSETGRVDIKGKLARFDVLTRYQINLFGRTFKIAQSTDKIPVVLILKNQGKNLIKPQGEIILSGNFGERAKYTLLPQNVLSQSERVIQATPSAEIDCSRNQDKPCKIPTSLIISGFFLGKYRLSTTVNFGQGTANIYATTSFYALPIKFLIGLIISLIVIGFILKRVRTD